MQSAIVPLIEPGASTAMALSSIQLQDIKMQNKLFVRNISYKTTEAELEKLFSQYGTVTSTRLATDRETGRPRGFGFVEMNTESEAQDAITGLNNTGFEGRTLFVAFSESQGKQRDTAYGSTRRSF